MAGTRMESRVEQLEKAVEEMQRKQDAEKLTGVDVTVNAILEQLSEFRAAYNAANPCHNQGSPIQNEPQHEDRTIQGNEQEGQNRGGSEQTGQNEAAKHRKLELPLFSGEDPLGWMFRVERYFAANAISEAEKLDAGVVGLEGKAITWFQWLETRSPVKSWQEFKKELIDRFHCRQLGDEYEQLFALKQEGTIAEYREQFELLSAPLEEVRDEILMGAFMNGLKEEIRCDVKLMHPQNLKQAMGYANQVEDRNWVKEKLEEKKTKAAKATSGSKWSDYRPIFSKFNNTETFRSISRPVTIKETKEREAEELRTAPSRTTTSIASAVSSNGGSTARKRLSEAEVNRRRELGLCFKCEEKYGPNHKCKNKRLQLMVLDEEHDGPEVENSEAQVEDGDEAGRDLASLELSMTTAVGLTGKRTLKMLGKMGEKEVLVLIDCGATHNFVSNSLVVELQIPTETVKQYAVTVGDGRKTISNLKCPEIALEIQGLKIKQPFYPFRLSNVDLVLGVEWLESLGETRMNWRQLYMKVRIDRRWVCLKGDPVFTQSQSSLKTLKRDILNEGVGYLVELWAAVAEEEAEQRSVNEEIAKILDEFPEVCAPIQGLPPPRTQDHTIVIKEGAQPTNTPLQIRSCPENGNREVSQGDVAGGNNSTEH